MTRPLTDAERKLRWQCRRGLKELDVILEPFMEEHYLDLAPDDQALFARLIAEEDVDLLAWFMQYLRPEDPELERMIHVVLRAVAR